MIITSFYAGILALWILFLAMRVVRFRQGQQVSLGDGGSEEGLRLTRCHANAIETIPIALIVLALSESSGAPAWVIHALGIALVVGRFLHGIHFLQNRRDLTFRFYGMVLTVAVIALGALGLIGHGLAGMFA